MLNRRKLGKDGELEAEKFIKKKKYQIIKCNYQISGGEIDIIAIDKNYLVFIEVKKRTNFKFGSGVSAVNKNKKSNIMYAAERFLYDNRENCEIMSLQPRFDVIEILSLEEKSTINHYIGIDMTKIKRKHQNTLKR